MGILILFFYLGTRKMSMVPKGLQNLVEWLVEETYGVVKRIVGTERARRFYPLVMTVFIFVLVANWLALLPVYSTFGRVELAEAVVLEKAEKVIEEEGKDILGLERNLSDEEVHRLAEDYKHGRLVEGSIDTFD
jgi:hypothetical protein